MLAESENTMHVPGGDFDTSTISKALADFESALSVAETKLISAGTNKIRANDDDGASFLLCTLICCPCVVARDGCTLAFALGFSSAANPGLYCLSTCINPGEAAS